MGNFEDRLKGYAKPDKGWHGRSHMDNINRWSSRASTNSQLAPRAAGKPSTNGVPERDLDPPSLPSTGKRVETRDTGMKPFVKRSVEATLKAARSDQNHLDEADYMPNVRRQTS
jgi:hypothetical protein